MKTLSEYINQILKKSKETENFQMYIDGGVNGFGESYYITSVKTFPNENGMQVVGKFRLSDHDTGDFRREFDEHTHIHCVENVSEVDEKYLDAEIFLQTDRALEALEKAKERQKHTKNTCYGIV